MVHTLIQLSMLQLYRHVNSQLCGMPHLKLIREQSPYRQVKEDLPQQKTQSHRIRHMNLV